MLRLTGGEFRNRSIHTPTDDRTRPTQAKLRQALFNSLQAQIPDAIVADLFAGSGSLGFEALSRGAARVVFVEPSKAALKLIEKNIELLGVADRVELVAEGIEKAVPMLQRFGPFDLVMADPPYAGGWEMKLLEEFGWNELLGEGGVLTLEWGMQKSRVKTLPDRVPFLVKVREKNYGDSVLTTYSRAES